MILNFILSIIFYITNFKKILILTFRDFDENISYPY